MRTEAYILTGRFGYAGAAPKRHTGVAPKWKVQDMVKGRKWNLYQKAIERQSELNEQTSG